MKVTIAGLMVFAALMTMTAYAQSPSPQVTIVANSIDLPLASGSIETLQSNGVSVSAISAQELPRHMNDTLIVLLGGQHAPEGVGPVVDGLLDQKEKDELIASPYARTVRVMPNVWRSGQNVLIFAGYDESQTQKAFTDSRNDLLKILKSDNITYIANYSSPTDHSTAAVQDYSQLRVC